MRRLLLYCVIGRVGIAWLALSLWTRVALRVRSQLQPRRRRPRGNVQRRGPPRPLHFIGQGGSSWRDPRNWSRKKDGQPLRHLHARGRDALVIGHVEGHDHLDLRGMPCATWEIRNYAGTVRLPEGRLVLVTSLWTRVRSLFQREVVPYVPPQFRQIVHATGGWRAAVRNRTAVLVLARRGALLFPVVAGGAGGPISFINSTTGNRTSAGALTINKPTGCQAGDVLIWGVECSVASGTIATPAGLTVIDTASVGPTFTDFYRVCDGSEGASFSFTLTGAGGSATCRCYRGISSAAPIHQHSAPARTAGSVNANASGVTTTIDGCMLVYLAGTGTAVETSFTVPSGFANGAFVSVASAGSSVSSDKTQATHGATGTITAAPGWVSTSATSYATCVALTPAPVWARASGVQETTPDTYAWTAPTGVTSVTVQLWGGGGGGSAGASSAGGIGGSGAGGSEYRTSVISVTPGTTYFILVGAGGAGGADPSGPGSNGVASLWQGTVIVAKPGTAGTSTGGAGGTGGTGTTGHNGGAGATGASSTKGGGGGSGGTGAAGNNASGSTNASAVTGGGAGGAGVPGGGGAGAIPGQGANGQSGAAGAATLGSFVNTVATSVTGATITDSFAVADTRFISDTGLTITDSIASVHILGVTLTDTGLTVTDSIASSRTHSLTDTGLTVTDSIAKASPPVTISDTGLAVSDAIAARATRSLADTGLTVSDSIGPQDTRTISDTGLAVSDSVTIVRVRAVAITDTGVTVSDSISISRVRAVATTDTGLTVSDSVAAHPTRAISTTGLTVSDSLVSTSLRSRSITDTGLSASDLIAKAVAHSLADTGLTISDALGTGGHPALSDVGLTVSDSLQKAAAKFVTDTGLAVSDSIVAGRLTSRAVTDQGVTISDSTATLRLRRLSDTGLAVSDSLAGHTSDSLTDTGLTVTDSIAARTARTRTLTDTGLTVADFLGHNAIVVRISITDTGLTISDSLRVPDVPGFAAGTDVPAFAAAGSVVATDRAEGAVFATYGSAITDQPGGLP